MTYIVIFINSIAFAYIADKSKYKSIPYFMGVLLSMLPLIVFGSFRDLTVGTDTMAYPMQVYNDVHYITSWEALTNIESIVEPLYVLMSYIVVHFLSDNVYSVLFMTQLLIVVCFYVGFIRMHKFLPLWLGVAFFCFLFFNSFLNMQRQGIAMSIVMIAISYLLERKIKPFLLLFVISFFFHRSSISALLFLPIIYYKNTKYNKYIVIGVTMVFIMYSFLLSKIVGLSGFSKYETYSVDGTYAGAFSLSEFILRIFFITLFFVWNRKHKTDVYYNIKAVFICEFIINLLQLKSAFIGRMGASLFLFYIPVLCCNIVKPYSRNIRVNRFLMVFGMIVFYWWFIFINKNAGETYPYKSTILNYIL